MDKSYSFGPFVLDAGHLRLFRQGVPVPVGPRALTLLKTLLEAGGQAVSKSALMDAAWQSVNIEESNLTVQIAALRKALGHLPNGEEWIATVQRVGYQFVGPLQPPQLEQAVPADRGNTPVSTKPSIAVLPFVNLCGDPEQEYFADGVADEIIVALSRFGALFVIARNSSFAYRGRAVGIKQIGQELGVAYVLEGSVRKYANRVRIAVQLVAAESSAHIWADRFEGDLSDIFELQDRLTESVVGALAPKLEKAEIERSRRKPTGSLDAYDYYLRGIAALHRWTSEGNDEALAHFYKSFELDPEFAAAYGFAARTYVQRMTVSVTTDVGFLMAETSRLARRAIALGRDDAVALSTAAFGLLCIASQMEEADGLLDRAIELNPNLAMAWYFSGWSKVYFGQDIAAMERFDRALKLNPRDSQVISLYAGLYCAHFVAGRYGEALAWNQKVERERSSIALQSCVAAACLAQLDRVAEARPWAEGALRAFPGLRLSNIHLVMFFRQPEHNARWKSALQLAGIPE